MSLIYKLRRADRAYYAGTPIMSDVKYDAMRRRAQKKFPEHPYFKTVGASIPGTVKVSHFIPMGSLDNVLNKDEFVKWYRRLNEPQLHIQQKMDGLSVELIYNDGVLAKAITRGDGNEGEDVTANVRKSENAVTLLKPLSIIKGKASVRAECLINQTHFEKYFNDMANARNAAAGTLRRQNGDRAEYLHFVAFDLIGSTVIDTEFEKIKMLKKLGLEVPQSKLVNDIEEAWYFIEKMEKRREELPYEIDGMVAKINVIDPTDAKEPRPKFQRAVKFKPRGGLTKLLRVVWQVGKTGVVVPVAKVKPVKVGGTVISSVTLCGPDEIKRLKVCKGDYVEVIRAADVIPKITRLVRKGKKRALIKSPEECPVCGEHLIKDKSRILCTNDNCGGRRFERIMSWITKRNILYLGSGILEAAVEEGLVNDIIDIYQLTIDEWAQLPLGNGVLGNSRARTIIKEIEKSRTVLLPDFIGSLSIPLLGRSMAVHLCEYLELESPEDFLNLNYRRLAKCEGFGPSRVKAVRDWIEKYGDDFRKLAKEMNFMKTNVSNGVLSGEKVCFTGDAGVRRNILQKLVTDNGGTCASSLTKDTTILVIADVNSTSTKARKAREYGTRLMSPVEFLDIVGYAD